jgi:hypothetical protein
MKRRRAAFPVLAIPSNPTDDQPTCMALTDFQTFQRIVALLQSEAGMGGYAGLERAASPLLGTCGLHLPFTLANLRTSGLLNDG